MIHPKAEYKMPPSSAQRVMPRRGCTRNFELWSLPRHTGEIGPVGSCRAPGKSGTEHGRRGTVDQSDFAGTQGNWRGLEDVGRPGDRDPPSCPGSLCCSSPALDGRYLSVTGKLTHKIYCNLSPRATCVRALVLYGVYPSLLQHLHAE